MLHVCPLSVLPFTFIFMRIFSLYHCSTTLPYCRWRIFPEDTQFIMPCFPSVFPAVFGVEHLDCIFTLPFPVANSPQILVLLYIMKGPGFCYSAAMNLLVWSKKSLPDLTIIMKEPKYFCLVPGVISHMYSTKLTECACPDLFTTGRLGGHPTHQGCRSGCQDLGRPIPLSFSTITNWLVREIHL